MYIHTVHNVFLSGIEKYGKVLVLFYLEDPLFKHGSARYEDFTEVQKEMEVELHNFQQHTEAQLLTMGPAIKRIHVQWEAIIQFVVELAKDLKKVPRSIKCMALGTIVHQNP